MKMPQLPGVFWIGLIVAIMTVIPLAGFDPMIAGLLLTALAAVARGLQVYFQVPDDQMPEIPEPIWPADGSAGPTPAASPSLYAVGVEVEAEPRKGKIRRFFLGE